MTAVVVVDPDNERGVRVIDMATGKIIAHGHLVVSLTAPQGVAARSAQVQFVEAVEQGH